MSASIDMKVTIASARQILHYKNIESLKLDKIKKEWQKNPRSMDPCPAIEYAWGAMDGSVGIFVCLLPEKWINRSVEC
jgi:hypothetical protein